MSDATVRTVEIVVKDGSLEMRMRVDEHGDLMLDAGREGDFTVGAAMVPALLKLLQGAAEEVSGG